jgi:hypothetical protein
MNPTTPRPEMASRSDEGSPAARLRRLVRKSALLNLVIVLTSGPVLIYRGGPRAVIPTLEIMAGITFVIWTATFAFFSFASISRILWSAFSYRIRRKPTGAAPRAGVADQWLDGPR